MAEQDEQQPDPAHGTDRGASQPQGPAEPVPSDPGAVEPEAAGAPPVGSGPAQAGPGRPEPGEVPAGSPGAGQSASPGDGADPGPKQPEFDEQAAWEAIVAGYGEEPPDPPGIRPFKPIEDLALLEPDGGDGWDGTGGRGRPARQSRSGDEDTEGDDTGSSRLSPEDSGGTTGRLGGSVSFAPGIGPRDHRPPAVSDDGTDDEGHFVPPEPPPLPAADATAKFAWLAVLGGPLLLLLAVLLGWQMTWWLTTLGIGGFIGGFVTLVIRMNPDDEDDDPGHGAVV